jgi:hypothetical protein
MKKPVASDFNVVSSLDNDDNAANYFCNYCNTKLHYQTTDEGTGKHEFWCTKCGISFIPANQLVKKGSKFETPEGPNAEPLTASIDDNLVTSSTTYLAAQNLPPLFESLKNKGFKWVHYEEH